MAPERRAAQIDGNAMAKLMRPADEAQALSARERVLLLCVASETNWVQAGIAGETVTAMIVKKFPQLSLPSTASDVRYGR
jgi:hypothetical protein